MGKIEANNIINSLKLYPKKFLIFNEKLKKLKRINIDSIQKILKKNRRNFSLILKKMLDYFKIHFYVFIIEY